MQATRGLARLLLRPRRVASLLAVVARAPLQQPALAALRPFHSSRLLLKKAAKSQPEPAAEAAELPDLAEVERRMEGSVEHLRREFGKLRGGRAEAGMFDHLTVDAYGSRTSLSQVAQVTVKSPTLVVMNVFDPMLANKVAEAVRDAGMNLNPSVETNSVVVPIPKASKETRDALVKVASREAEQAKQALRRVRKSAMDDAKKLKGQISDDDIHRYQKQLDHLTEELVKRINALYEEKAASISKV